MPNPCRRHLLPPATVTIVFLFSDLLPKFKKNYFFFFHWIWKCACFTCIALICFCAFFSHTLFRDVHRSRDCVCVDDAGFGTHLSHPFIFHLLNISHQTINGVSLQLKEEGVIFIMDTAISINIRISLIDNVIHKLAMTGKNSPTPIQSCFFWGFSLYLCFLSGLFLLRSVIFCLLSDAIVHLPLETLGHLIFYYCFSSLKLMNM